MTSPYAWYRISLYLAHDTCLDRDVAFGQHNEGAKILASDVVRQIVAGKGFLFADRGESALRGFEVPVHQYEVRWHAED